MSEAFWDSEVGRSLEHAQRLQASTNRFQPDPNHTPATADTRPTAAARSRFARSSKPPRQLLTVVDVARILRIRPTEARRMVELGEIPHLPVRGRPRIRPESLTRFIETAELEAIRESGGAQ